MADRTLVAHVCHECRGAANENVAPDGTHYCDRPCKLPAPMGLAVSVVEESRLREAEAERESMRLERNAALHNHGKDNEHWAARVVRLEAELREAREALSVLADPPLGVSFHAALSRARGVLEKGDTPA